MKKISLLLVALIILTLTSCQSCSRKFGGTTTVNIDKDDKFVNITWKESNIWVLVQKPNGNYEFSEYSNMGLLEGKVIIKKK